MPDHPEPGQAPPRRKRAYNTDLSPAELSARARAASLAMWAGTADRTARTERARAAADARFYREADEAGITDPASRERMAATARRAEMARVTAIRLRKQRQRRQAAAARADEIAAWVAARGSATYDEIAAGTGITSPGLYLLQLVRDGRLARTGPGLYAPPGQDGAA